MMMKLSLPVPMRLLSLLAVPLLLAALACGPAAPADQSGGITSPTAQERPPAQESAATPEGRTGAPPAPQASEPTPIPPPTLSIENEPTTPPTPPIGACYSYTINIYLDGGGPGPEDLEGMALCYERQLEHFLEFLEVLPGQPDFTDLQPVWREVQEKAAADPAVIEAQTKVLVCLAEEGYRNVDWGMLFPWQNLYSPKEYRAMLAGYSVAERALQRELAPLADECAGPSGYYWAQSEAWLAEVRRLVAEEPGKAQILQDTYILRSLEGLSPEYRGIAHFLTLKLNILRATPGAHYIEPVPTPFPTVDPNSQSDAPLNSDTPHPEGLAGCQNLSIFTSSVDDIKYYFWCSEASGDAVISQCRGIGTTQEERSCAEEYLADWKQYSHRLNFICTAISDTEVGRECFYQAADTSNKSEEEFRRLWPEIQAVEASNPAVAMAHQKVTQCLADKSFRNIDPKLLFQWQKYWAYFGDSTAFTTWLDGFTEKENALMEEIANPLEQCAIQEGFYAAQEAVWLVEVRRLIKEDPDKAQPLLDWKILEILEQPGVAPFLTNPDS